MANTKVETTPSITKAERAGFVPSVVNLAIDVADRGQATAIAVLQDARGELRTAIESGVDFAEKLTAALFRFTRKGIQRLDEASAEAISGAGGVFAGAVKTARDTTRAATDLANTATAGFTGPAAQA